MAATHFLEFHPADNPMQLSKIGNWVFTFLNPENELVDIRLAISSVLTRQVGQYMQLRRICISKTDLDQRWLIDAIECYDSQTGQDLVFSAADEMGHAIMDSLISEFSKYDVPLQLI